MKISYKLLLIIMLLMMLSIANIYIANPSYMPKQVLWYFLGFGLFYFFSKINFKIVLRLITFSYWLLNGILIYLLLFGTTINGSRAWLNFGLFSFQPSEFIKIILIIYLSMIIAQKEKYFFKTLVIVLIPSVLTFLEPDTGNVIFYLAIWFALIFYQLKNLKPLFYLLGLVFILLAGFISFYHFNQNLFIKIFGTSFFYRMDRLVAFTDNSSYQLKNALIGIGSSALIGPFQSRIYIPEAITDFAFALLISNMGLLVGIGYLIINLGFNFLLIKMYQKKHGVMKSITFIFLLVKVMQESIHVLMNIGLFPITGITLPFISYGGSSLLSYFIILGIINNHKVDMGMDYSRG